MKRISLRVSMLILLVNSAGAQTDPPDWHRYTVKNEKFSVALPAQPSLEYRRRQVDARGDRLEIEDEAKPASTIAAAIGTKFTPAMKDGKHVSMWIQLEYNFNLY